jgi:uncharacterized protein DUF2726
METVIIVLGIFILVCLVLFTLLVKQKEPGVGQIYVRREYLLTPAERSFYGVLKNAIPSEIDIMCKVRVADVLKPFPGMSRSDWQIAFNKITGKHFDFVLCSADTSEVQVVIELDDKSHNTKSRMKRDEFLVHACADADLPLIRFKAKRSYVPDEITQEIKTVLVAESNETR